MGMLVLRDFNAYVMNPSFIEGIRSRILKWGLFDIFIDKFFSLSGAFQPIKETANRRSMLFRSQTCTVYKCIWRPNSLKNTSMSLLNDYLNYTIEYNLCTMHIKIKNGTKLSQLMFQT